jgi:thiamine pyrophosphate-dependent acetolactate synthase large subunit-like protein
MSASNIKVEIQHLVTNERSEAVLQKVLRLLKHEDDEQSNNWWNTLTEEQQLELDRAEEEIKDPNNLIGHKEAMETARQFIKKDNFSDNN